MKTQHEANRHRSLKAFVLLITLFGTFNCYASGHNLGGVDWASVVFFAVSLASTVLALFFAIIYTFWAKLFLKVLVWVFSLITVLVEIRWAPHSNPDALPLVLMLPIIAGLCIYLVQRKRTVPESLKDSEPG